MNAQTIEQLVDRNRRLTCRCDFELASLCSEGFGEKSCTCGCHAHRATMRTLGLGTLELDFEELDIGGKR